MIFNDFFLAQFGTKVAVTNRMPRSLRNLQSQSMIHFIGRANNDLPLFRRHADYKKFRRTLFQFTHDQQFFIHHYALMRTHVHILAWIEEAASTPDIIKSIALSYYHYYRRRYKIKGHLWHGRYRSIAIQNESHWLQCGRYIELNPVHAGICKDPAKYPWSSYHYYASGKKDALVRARFHAENDTSDKMEEYRNFIMAGIDMDYQRLKHQYEKCRNSQ